MKKVIFTSEEVELLKAYLIWTAQEVTKAKEDLKNIELLLNKLEE